MELKREIGEILRKEGMTLSVAESCTGGLICDQITNVPGSSDYFEGGMVAYSIREKVRHLHIPVKEIERYGVVSSQIAKQMAIGVRKAFSTNFGLSTTGVAGPTGGTKKTPVGTVFIAVADGEKTLTRKLKLKGSRPEIKEKAAGQALRFFYEKLTRLKTDRPSGTARPMEDLRRSKRSEIQIVRWAPQGISGRRGRLGIFPASFNPPTLAHIALIREAFRKVKLNEVLVLLDLQAMDKNPVEATFEDRLAMLKKIFGRAPMVSIGLSKQGLFLKKLKPLRALYPNCDELIFLVGFDTLLRVMDKKYYKNRRKSLDELFRQSRFLVANRDLHEETAFENLFRKKENKRYAERVAFFTLPKRFSSLSSSLVRKRLAQGRPVDRWVPAVLLPFLKAKELYRTQPKNR